MSQQWQPLMLTASVDNVNDRITQVAFTKAPNQYTHTKLCMRKTRAT